MSATFLELVSQVEIRYASERPTPAIQAIMNRMLPWRPPKGWKLFAVTGWGSEYDKVEPPDTFVEDDSTGESCDEDDSESASDSENDIQGEEHVENNGDGKV